MGIWKLRLWKRLNLVEAALWADGRAFEDIDHRLTRLERPKDVLVLKPSRKRRVFTAPLCPGQRKKADGTAYPCPNHTRHASGYCKEHREGVSATNGMVVEPQTPV